MKKITSLLILAGFSCMAFAQKTATIGTQVWMAENLNVTSFRNGNPIKEAKTNEEWQQANNSKQPAWCYYDNKASNRDTFGILYNWYAVNDSRGLAPLGWHIATDKDWDILIKTLKLDSAGIKMKYTKGWYANGNGNNKSGFAGMPGGLRGPGGYFENFRTGGYFWSYTGDVPNKTCIPRNLDYTSNYLFGYSSGAFMAEGYSVRCVRD
jgi:uncharacterized protein (TIGR02145 family)